MADDTVQCPKCGSRIPISKVLTDQIRTDLEKSFEGRLRDERSQMRSAMDLDLRRERAKIESEAARKANEKSRIELEKLRQESRSQAEAAQRLTSRLETQERSMASEIEKRVQKERKQLQAQVEEQSRAELDRLRGESKVNADNVKKLNTRLEMQERAMEAELKKRLSGARKQIENDVEERLTDEHRSRELAAQRQLSDARLQINDLKRKLDNSSRQLEGEVVEGNLHEILAKAYPTDDVRPISKRGGGADVHQHVNSSAGREIGSIVWESKNTAVWSNSWLAKLRQDQRRAKADFAVLVTAVRPKNCGKLEFRDGVWITEHSLAIGLAAVLRSSLITLSQYKDLPPETAEKFAVIQRYLSSTEFRQRIEAIVEAFQTMCDELTSEKRAAERHWAQREKQLQMVIENVSGMYGELRAVVGPTLARVRRLELPGS